MKVRLLSGMKVRATRAADFQGVNWSLYGLPNKESHSPWPLSAYGPYQSPEIWEEIWKRYGDWQKFQSPFLELERPSSDFTHLVVWHQKNPFVNCDSSTGSKIHNLLGQENILIFTKPPTNLFLWRKCFDLTWVYGNGVWALAWQSKNSSSRPGWAILTTLFLSWRPVFSTT